jgi:hypothetical protein
MAIINRLLIFTLFQVDDFFSYLLAMEYQTKIR